MKTQDIIKYLAMAAAAYLAYRWLVQQLIIPDYLGLVKGYPSTADQLSAIKAQEGVTPDVYAQLVAGGQAAANQPGPGNSSPQPGNQTQAGGNQNQTQGSGGGNNNTSTSGPGSNTPTGGGGVASGSVKESVALHAKNEATANAGLLHFWQWNFHLPSNVAPPDPFAVSGWENTSLGRPPQSTQEVETTPLTIDQWWAMAAPAMGLAGITTPGNPSMRGVNHWGQQASQWNSQPGMHGLGNRARGGGRGFGDLRGGF